MKPILFNTEMVKAILDGRKSVTRRVVKPQPFSERKMGKQPCRPGDILYVRETWALQFGLYWHKAGLKVDENGCDTHGTLVPTKWRPSIHMPKEAARLFLRVTDVRVERLQNITPEQLRAEGVKIFLLPSECQRMFNRFGAVGDFLEKKKEFAGLWDNTIKKADLPLYGWNANPWVWVIEFERISKEEAREESTNE